MELSPQKIYEGYNSILRNIVPGIIILFPFIVSFGSDFLKENYYIIIITYLIVEVLSYGIFDGIGYLYLRKIKEKGKKDNILKKLKNGLQLMLPRCEFIRCIIAISLQLLWFIVSLPVRCFWIIISPTFYEYSIQLENKINELLRSKNFPTIRYVEYKELQDTKKYRLCFGDHSAIHILNSYMVLCDISIIGLILVLLVALLAKIFSNNDILTNNIIYSFDCYVLAWGSFLLLAILFPLKRIIKYSLPYIELDQLEKFGIDNFGNLMQEFRNKRDEVDIFGNEKTTRDFHVVDTVRYKSPSSLKPHPNNKRRHRE
ncbi:MAG: hypothetical protein EPN93_05490 [Spirochaetes bacterium]|nr:MAG: hypothetical protein EPN93_05490 [Spirochaetota bacterium]